MALASAHRVTFSVLAVPLQQELGLSLPQMGILQSAVLAGYILGQASTSFIPLGIVADRIGGTPVMHVSIFLWSCVTGLTSFVRGAPQSLQFPALLIARVTLGLGQSCIMPATSAMAAKWVPHQYRARAMSFVYAAFSLGMVAGLVCFPAVAAPFGWPTALVVFAAGGIAWGASAVGGMVAGWLADHLQESHQWKPARVRAFIQTVATIGPAVSLIPLILAKNSCGLHLAVACLTAFMGLQAFAYSGFHAYVQEVAPSDAGKLLGLSNSASTLVGMAGNVVTGGMAASSWGYSGLFAVTAVLYTGSCLTWNACMKGQPLNLNLV
ncbi:major facilitator superfamily transporter [Coccomyxa subellipsoidea C-169]|uniref:Major facilitator superfamily transporter n=1 Tax=Coccomyxa subellipsoidea (strain C-169) TaxID=574566 RepID=I0YQD2_COCSC|nr:major facilitator superfamily transporter [Coccomyxa subellipsoidea C-169]EIE20601.1 major facilitator superfamily transporter [Coccomyxa subellipsoidea C-169]|eukprot:XP_005645145.1 major facilitator superfamily transporter [Coccomyxa subellipsoidea C-169]